MNMMNIDCIKIHSYNFIILHRCIKIHSYNFIILHRCMKINIKFEN